MRKFTTLFVGLVVCLTMVFALVGCGDDAPTGADATPLKVDMADSYYLGTNSYSADYAKTASFDLSKHFGDVAISLVGTPTNVSLSGKEITVNGLGDFSLKAGDDTKTVTVVEGVNVATYEELYSAVTSDDVAVMQTNMEMNDMANAKVMSGLTIVSTITLMAKNDIYGNGHSLDASAIIKKGGAIACVSQGVDIRDLHIFGAKFVKDVPLDMNKFEETKQIFSSLISFDTPANEENYSGSIKHCLIENGHKVVFINAANVEIEGCIIRNASDSLISVQTNNDGEHGARIKLKNNVLLNSVVAGVVMFGWDAVNDDKNYVQVDCEGFLDIYNWKESSSAKIMPRSEDFSAQVNNLIKGEFKKAKYKDYLYEEDGKSYAHVGMVVLSTGHLDANKAKINGLKELGMEQRAFPMPALGKKIAKTCDVVNFTGNDPKIKPKSKIGDHLDKLYVELREGRQAD
ncbi:MAG: hypothetical protein RR123_06225 [Clostridia bacterium]